MDPDVSNALSERLNEVINEFAEANKITTNEVLAAVDLTYAACERSCKNAPAWRKMH